MFSGPYNTPPVFRHTPIAALFWTLLAPVLFLNIGILIAGAVTGGWATAQFQDGGSPAQQWTVLVLLQCLLFAAISLWAQRMGAGPFAGSMKLDSDWLAISAMTGPVILLGTSILVGLLVGGTDPNWMYREEFDLQLMSSAAIGWSMLLGTVLLFPLTEEIAFRGVALGWLLARGIPPALSALAISLLFAAAHQQYSLMGMIPIFVMGLYLCWLRVATGTIAAPIVSHMSANAISVGLFIAANQ